MISVDSNDEVLSLIKDAKNKPYGLETVGRINNFLDGIKFEEEKLLADRLPESCTCFVVEDTVAGHPDSIINSWVYTAYGVRRGAGVAIILDKLRPKGTVNKQGLIASGPTSFATIYSQINDVFLRGGIKLKKGAVTLHLDADHPDVEEFINAPRSALAWAKRCLNVDPLTFKNHPLLENILARIADGTLFLVKKEYDAAGNRIYGNVCLEIRFRHRATCLLAHVNAGLLTKDELLKTYVESMHWLCKLHNLSGVFSDADPEGMYLSKKEDRQVGLGVLGLANQLAIAGITYRDFVNALEFVNNIPNGISNAEELDLVAYELAQAYKEAYTEAAKVAKSYNMERAFTIAPTANCSFNGVDLHGYTTAPEIAPPVNTLVERDSEVEHLITREYHPDCEIAIKVGYDLHFRLNNAWQAMMDSTGLGHAISFNWWRDVTKMDVNHIERWLDSNLKSLYYAWPVNPYAQDKSQLLNVSVGSSEKSVIDSSLDTASLCAVTNKDQCTACVE